MGRAAAAVLPILVLTLWPHAPGPADTPRLCLTCGSDALADAILNALLFMPLGWVLSHRRGALGVAVIAAGLSTSIEGAQLLLPGRYSSAVDVLANALGASLAAAARHRPVKAVGAAALVSAALLLAPVFLLAPDPPPGVYYGQWTARFGNMAPYEGRVLDAEVAGLQVPSTRSPETDELRGALRAGRPVRIRLHVGPPPPAPSPIFSVFDDRRREVFMLGADGSDIFVRLWRRSTTLGLRTPWWRWEGAMTTIATGDTIEIAFEVGDAGPCLTIQGRKRCRTATSDLGAWSVLSPFEEGDRPVSLPSLAWALLLGLPFGLLPGRLGPRVAAALLLGGLVAAGSLARPYWVSPWLGLPPFLLGSAAGAVLRGLWRPGRRPEP